MLIKTRKVRESAKVLERRDERCSHLSKNVHLRRVDEDSFILLESGREHRGLIQLPLADQLHLLLGLSVRARGNEKELAS